MARYWKEMKLCLVRMQIETLFNNERIKIHGRNRIVIIDNMLIDNNNITGRNLMIYCVVSGGL